MELIATLRKDGNLTDADERERLERIEPHHAALRLAAGTHFNGTALDAIQPMPPMIAIVALNPQPGVGTTNPDDVPPKQARALVGDNAQGGFHSAFISMHPYLEDLAEAFYDAEDTRNRLRAEELLAGPRAFNAILERLTGWTLGAGIKDGGVVPLLGDRAFAFTELSEGQKLLIAWAIVLHRQRATLQNSIITLDEPENHFHPDVCVRVIRALLEFAPTSQVWVATHSVPLIAYAGMERVHLVEGGRVTYGGNQIDRVMERLLGGPEGREQLHTFWSDADELGYFNFAAQCLLDPEVADFHARDDQPDQVAETAGAAGLPTSARVLDYGAGRGRLASALARQRDEGVSVPFEYFAVNHPAFTKADDRNRCKAEIARLHGAANVETHYTEDLEGFMATGQRMDGVVLCNVFHEVPVADWLTTLGQIHGVLAEHGVLIIVEDMLPSVGELPNRNGYVILDEPALRALVAAPGEHPHVRVGSSEREGRLLAFIVQRAALLNVSSETVERALESVQGTAIRGMRAAREAADRETFQGGRRHAHYSMLYANASLSREDLRGAGA